jgi:hypothetical protein
MFILLGLFLIYTQSYTHFCSYQKTLCAISVILQKSHKSDIQQFDCVWLFVIFRSREPVFPLKSSTQVELFAFERRDENPRVRYREALATARIPVFPLPKDETR